jgi:hypothetical protein
MGIGKFVSLIERVNSFESIKRSLTSVEESNSSPSLFSVQLLILIFCLNFLTANLSLAKQNNELAGEGIEKEKTCAEVVIFNEEKSHGSRVRYEEQLWNEVNEKYLMASSLGLSHFDITYVPKALNDVRGTDLRRTAIAFARIHGFGVRKWNLESPEILVKILF